MATNNQGLNRGIVGNVKHETTGVGTRAFIYITCSKPEANKLRVVAAAKPAS